MKKHKVFIVGNDSGIARMYTDRGHEIVHKQEHASIVQYIGGADINPKLYGEKALPCTRNSPGADARDYNAWQKTVSFKQMSVGICRGGQFLNVMNNGFMWQHVSGHTASHKVVDLTGLTQGKEILVTSTHHQMMIPHETGEVLAYADNISTHHQSASDRKHDGIDVEVVWYDKTRCLCYQPHPEYGNYKENTDYFFNLIALLS